MNRIDIGNVRGIQGEKGDKGDKGKTPTFQDLKYERKNDEFVYLKTKKQISQTQLYIDKNHNLCDNEGHLLDSNHDATEVVGEPFDENKYGYSYQQLWVDTDGKYTNSKGELLDEDYNPLLVETSFINDISNFIYNDTEKLDGLVELVYPHVVDELLSSEPDGDYSEFFKEIEGDVKYYICSNNPKTNIYINDQNVLINACTYEDENGNVVVDDNNTPLPVPLEKNTLYLYAPYEADDNDAMHYDIYICTKANTVPKKLVSANDFVLNYNVIDDIGFQVEEDETIHENNVYLKTSFRGSGRVYTASEVDTLFMNNVINKLGADSGIAQLNSSGKVPSSQLPAYVDEVVQGTMNSAETVFTPVQGYSGSVTEEGKIYVDTNTKKTYRYVGNGYIPISSSTTVDDGTTIAYGSAKGQALETKIGNSLLNTTSQTITGAINEHETDITSLNSGKQDKTDNSLNTSLKTVSGAINELNTNKISKSGTVGLVKNDGSIETRIFALANHTHTSSDISDLETEISDDLDLLLLTLSERVSEL